MDQILINKLAHVFADVLKERLTSEQVHEINRRNASLEYGGNTCASHDFCDANMVMDAAFTGLLGREMLIDDDDDLAACNSAWTIAKDNAFFTETPSNTSPVNQR
jgi:hypothetical protein